MDAPTPASPGSADALTLDQLRLFLAVLDAGSFSAAARALRRAQSVVSYGIANLERQLGVSLFDRVDRARRRPALTPAGVALAAEARAVCSQVDQLKAKALGVARGVEPQLAVAVDHLFPLPAMVRALGAFREQFPTVALTLHTEALGAVAELVVQGTCSVGIGSIVPKIPDSIERRPLARVTIVHVVSPAHAVGRSSRKGPIPARLLRDHVQIVLADRSRLTAGFEVGVFGGRQWRVLDLTAKHALLRAGLGWGGMPMHVVDEDLAKKRLVRLHIQEAEASSIEAVLFAMHRTAEPPGPAARWLLDRLEQGCRTQK